ncbi:MAG: hypothetical protein IJ735_00850 [Clostridia bacterium]|nr:hypothetical protein [Clostridia bacterium]
MNDNLFDELSHNFRSQFGDLDKAVGLTKHEYTFGRKNMPLSKNPQKGKTEKAYIRNGIISDSKEAFSRKTKKNLSFDKDDFALVKSKIRNYKKKSKKKGK